MTTLECKNRNHVIKTVYGKIGEGKPPIQNVYDVVKNMDDATAISAALYWKNTPRFQWAVKCARIINVNRIPDDICNACVNKCG